MYIINFYECGVNVCKHMYFHDLVDCLDYLESIFGHFSEHHQNVNFKFSFCYKPKEALKDVQS